ncbi:MAG TPA: hypothetical protein VM490_03485, partial [Armatimonadaceae bacterium]|nr:hypothetical protein [Armatimonadaceae bacterium]
HARIACRWRRAPVIPFERYVRHPDIEGFLAGGHGFLASGPERLMRAYAEALTPYGLGPYLSAAVGAYYPQRTGIENVPDAPGEPPLKALLVGSATFVVGRVFTAHRIAGPPPD